MRPVEDGETCRGGRDQLGDAEEQQSARAAARSRTVSSDPLLQRGGEVDQGVAAGDQVQPRERAGPRRRCAGRTRCSPAGPGHISAPCGPSHQVPGAALRTGPARTRAPGTRARRAIPRLVSSRSVPKIFTRADNPTGCPSSLVRRASRSSTPPHRWRSRAPTRAAGSSESRRRDVLLQRSRQGVEGVRVAEERRHRHQEVLRTGPAPRGVGDEQRQVVLRRRRSGASPSDGSPAGAVSTPCSGRSRSRSRAAAASRSAAARRARATGRASPTSPPSAPSNPASRGPISCAPRTRSPTPSAIAARGIAVELRRLRGLHEGQPVGGLERPQTVRAVRPRPRQDHPRTPRTPLVRDRRQQHVDARARTQATTPEPSLPARRPGPARHGSVARYTPRPSPGPDRRQPPPPTGRSPGSAVPPAGCGAPATGAEPPRRPLARQQPTPRPGPATPPSHRRTTRSRPPSPDPTAADCQPSRRPHPIRCRSRWIPSSPSPYHHASPLPSRCVAREPPQRRSGPATKAWSRATWCT